MNFGFVANLDLSTSHNSFIYLSTMPTWSYFNRPTNLAFHDLTTRLKPPPNLRSLLGLSLKFIPNPPYNVEWTQYIEKTLPKLERDLQIKIFYANNPPDENFNQRLHVESNWKPPAHMVPRELPRRLRDFTSGLQALVLKTKSKSNLQPYQLAALHYLRNQTDFLVVHCDKNLGPAIIERTEYINLAIRDHLSHPATYRRLTEAEANLKKNFIITQLQR